MVAISRGDVGSVAGSGKGALRFSSGRNRIISRPSEESTRRSTAGGAQSADSSMLSMNGFGSQHADFQLPSLHFKIYGGQPIGVLNWSDFLNGVPILLECACLIRLKP